MGVQIKNNAYSTLLAGITSTATTINVAVGEGAHFPSASVASGNYFYATIIDTSNNLEVVKVTDRSNDTLTVARGQDGTTARSFALGDRIELRVTAALLGDLPIRTINEDDIDDGAVVSSKLAASGVSAGQFGGNGLTPRITVNSKGLVTAITEDAAVVDRQIFTGDVGGATGTNFTWTKPNKGTYALIQMWGGGAGGTRTAANGSHANGGGGGGYLEKFILLADLPNASYSGTVGQGGAGKTSSDGNGASGGTTTFLGYSVGGGEGRLGIQQGVSFTAGDMNVVALGGAPFTTLPGGQQTGDGVATAWISTAPSWRSYLNQFANFCGGAGVRKDTTKRQMVDGYTISDGNGQNSIFGGGGGGGKPVAAGAASSGGQSMAGGNGGASSVFDSGSGSNGSTPGGGGGGGFSAGGSGGAGRVVITVW